MNTLDVLTHHPHLPESLSTPNEEENPKHIKNTRSGDIYTPKLLLMYYSPFLLLSSPLPSRLSMEKATTRQRSGRVMSADIKGV